MGERGCSGDASRFVTPSPPVVLWRRCSTVGRCRSAVGRSRQRPPGSPPRSTASRPSGRRRSSARSVVTAWSRPSRRWPPRRPERATGSSPGTGGSSPSATPPTTVRRRLGALRCGRRDRVVSERRGYWLAAEDGGVFRPATRRSSVPCRDPGERRLSGVAPRTDVPPEVLPPSRPRLPRLALRPAVSGVAWLRADVERRRRLPLGPEPRTAGRPSGSRGEPPGKPAKRILGGPSPEGEC